MMEIIDSKKLTRDSNLSSKIIKKIGTTYIALEEFYILYPNRYIEIGLAESQTNTKLVSYFMMVYKNKYTVAKAPVYVTLEPNLVSNVEIDDVLYKKLVFNKGDIVIPDTNSVVDSGILYKILNDFFINGKIPYFLSYDDISELIAKSKKYLKSDIGTDTLSLEILAAIITRDKNDKAVPYRYKYSEKNLDGNNYIGLQNVFYTFNDTTSKLAGSYFANGINSSLIDPEKEVTSIEYLLRK